MRGNKENVKANYEVSILRAHELDASNIAFDMEVNGVKIYGCFYKEGKTKGKEWSFISFPSEKCKDGNYYNKAYFPIDDELKEDILAKIEDALKE